MKFKNKFKLLTEMVFAICYIAAISAKGTDNIAFTMVVLVPMLLVLYAISIFRYKRQNSGSILIYLLLATIGIGLIFSRDFMDSDKISATLILIAGTLMCFPFIAKTV